jgi:hypothetical protein
MTGPRRLALQGWIVIGLPVLILLRIVGLGAEINFLPYLWRDDAPTWTDDGGAAEGQRRSSISISNPQ